MTRSITTSLLIVAYLLFTVTVIPHGVGDGLTVGLSLSVCSVSLWFIGASLSTTHSVSCEPTTTY